VSWLCIDCIHTWFTLTALDDATAELEPCPRCSSFNTKQAIPEVD